jgi:hypothetical protein
MMDARQLRHEADRKRAEAEQRRKIAERKRQDASGHHDIGLDYKADVEEREVQALDEEANRLEQQAAQLTAQFDAAVAAGLALQEREKAIKREYEQKLKDIEDEKRRLLG